MAQPLRRQPPAYSPLSLGALATAVVQGLFPRSHGEPRLACQLAHDYGADQVILCGSATQALQLALRAALDDQEGEPLVALPSFTCYDVASAAVGADARITLYDIDPITLGPDFDSLRRTLANGAQVVVVSPLYGIPIDWAAVEECLAPHGAVVIEDAAQGHGASWRSRPLGSMGELSVLSFARGKGRTGIRGGALLLRPPPGLGEGGGKIGFTSEAKIVLGGLAQWALGRPSLYGLPASIPWLGLGETTYHAPVPPTRMARTAVALVALTVKDADQEAAVRRANAARLLADLHCGPHLAPIVAPEDGTPGYLRLPLRLSGGLAGFSDRARAERLGVAPSYPTTLAALESVRARMNRPPGELPGGEELSLRLVTVPTHSRLSVEDRQEVLRLLNTYAG
jgi:dTDP-4-amino-4,6-dideoxygalactose transaminase